MKTFELIPQEKTTEYLKEQMKPYKNMAQLIKH